MGDRFWWEGAGDIFYPRRGKLWITSAQWVLERIKGTGRTGVDARSDLRWFWWWGAGGDDGRRGAQWGGTGGEKGSPRVTWVMGCAWEGFEIQWNLIKAFKNWWNLNKELLIALALQRNTPIAIHICVAKTPHEHWYGLYQRIIMCCLCCRCNGLLQRIYMCW
jgi:hypothetical protein